MPFPDINPVLLHIGPLAIHWYALAYVAGILLGAWYIDWLNKKAPVLKDLKPFDDLLVYAILGILLGGRLGYTLFYNTEYYLTHPGDILKMWQGGMSFHGGLIGFIISIWIFSKRKHYNFWTVIDVCACAAPIGLALGRITNFVNAELYGRPTNLPWGVIFPGGGDVPRHPSQLYESALEGVLLFMVLYLLVQCTKVKQKPGSLSGVFLLGYALARFSVEYVREPDAQLGFVVANLTMGQLLTLPMMALGLWLILRKTNGTRKTS